MAVARRDGRLLAAFMAATVYGTRPIVFGGGSAFSARGSGAATRNAPE
jgi:hypothetical protein